MPNGRTWQEELDSIMPTDMTTKEIARYYNVPTKRMETYLLRYGFLPDVDYRRAKTRYDWDAVDWSKSNTTIAKELGCDRTTVWLRRKRRE